MQSLVFGAMIMGLGGALYAHFTIAISPEVFTPLYGTFIIWVMVIAGGSGNNKGVILGAFVVWAIWTGTRFLTDFLPYTLKSRAPYIRFLVIGIVHCQVCEFALTGNRNHLDLIVAVGLDV